MVGSTASVDRSNRRRVFEAWSVEIPVAFAESFVDDSYWHSFDDDRSVSMSSILLSDPNGPVSADRILSELPSLEGQAIDELPAGLVGRAATGPRFSPQGRHGC